ncbi:MAG: hypothetical protein ABI382_00820 [Nakamurella sp.]
MGIEQGLSLTDPEYLLKLFTENVVETSPNEEMVEYLGHEKNRVTDGRESTNVRRRRATSTKSIEKLNE